MASRLQVHHRKVIHLGLKVLNIEGMKTESDFPDVYMDHLCQYGLPHTLKRDNAKCEDSERTKVINRKYCISNAFTEPYHPQHNVSELNGVRFLKSNSKVLMDQTGTPDYLWFLVQKYICEVYNCSANPHIDWATPYQRSNGNTVDISHILQFSWLEPVYYLNPSLPFPESTEEAGFFVGFAPNVGDALTFKILKDDMKNVIH